MTTANINWTFGQLAGSSPIANCALTVLVVRDGINVGSFVVNTNASGAASGVYQDTTASATATHQYVLTPQISGCASGCTVVPVTVNWNCAGTAPPPPPPVPPPPPAPAPGCPSLADTFSPVPTNYSCGGTVTGTATAMVGIPFSFTQDFIGTTVVTGTSTMPGVSVASGTSSATASGTPTISGTYSITFTGSGSATCPPCSITHRVAVSATSCATQSVRVLQGSSAYTPASFTNFNAADQLLEVSLTGPVGQTFQLVGTGTVNTTSPVLTIPVGGVFTFSTATGQSSSYSTDWGFVPAGSNPVTICNPTPVTVTGNTCLTLNVTQTGADYSFTVAAPSGATNVPFTLSFGGASFGGSASCAANSYGVVNNLLTTGSSGGTNVFSYGPVAVTAPYSAAIKLEAGASSATHMVCGTACQEVVFV